MLVDSEEAMDEIPHRLWLQIAMIDVLHLYTAGTSTSHLAAVPGCFRVAELPSELAGRSSKQSSFDGDPMWSSVIMYASDLTDTV